MGVEEIRVVNDPSCKKQSCLPHARGWQRMLQSQVWNASWLNSFHLAGLWTLPQTWRNRWNNTKCKDKKHGKWCWKSNHEIQACLMILSIPREKEFQKTRRNLKGFGKHEEKIIEFAIPYFEKGEGVLFQNNKFQKICNYIKNLKWFLL